MTTSSFLCVWFLLCIRNLPPATDHPACIGSPWCGKCCHLTSLIKFWFTPGESSLPKESLQMVLSNLTDFRCIGISLSLSLSLSLLFFKLVSNGIKFNNQRCFYFHKFLSGDLGVHSLQSNTVTQSSNKWITTKTNHFVQEADIPWVMDNNLVTHQVPGVVHPFSLWWRLACDACYGDREWRLFGGKHSPLLLGIY